MMQTRKNKAPKVVLMLPRDVPVVKHFVSGFFSYARPKCNWIIYWGKPSDFLVADMENYGVDYIVTAPSSKSQPRLEVLGVPILYTMSPRQPESDLWFRMDEEAIGVAAAEHILASGYQYGASLYVGDHYGAKKRRDGFARTMEAAGAEVFGHPIVNHPRESPKNRASFFGADEDMAGWLRSLPKSTGIYAWSDAYAEKLSEVAFYAGLSVPRDLGIVGTDNDVHACLTAYPNLDSVAISYRDLGEAAARWIEASIKGRKGVVPEPLKPIGVVRRKSTDIQVLGDGAIQKATRLIRDLPLSGLSVDRVVTEMPGVSKRTLQRQFPEATGRTLQELIEIRRLHHAEYLLANTNDSVNEVSKACGFATFRSLDMLFRKFHETSPAGFRSIMQHAF